MEAQKNFDHIPGWGVDADPGNDPTYPMKNSKENEHEMNWTRPPLQTTDIEVLQSNERPYMTAVYGTSTPPSGLSGALRRYAFRYSESNAMHWISLLLADRINVVEGLVNDLSSGRVPNLAAERGSRAAWKYDTKKQVLKVIAFGIISISVLALLKSKKSTRR